MENDRQGESENGAPELPRQPAYYFRSATPFTLGTALALLAGAIGLLSYTHAVEQALRIEIANAENRLINRLQGDEVWLRECCGKR